MKNAITLALKFILFILILWALVVVGAVLCVLLSVEKLVDITLPFFIDAGDFLIDLGDKYCGR